MGKRRNRFLRERQKKKKKRKKEKKRKAAILCKCHTQSRYLRLRQEMYVRVS